MYDPESIWEGDGVVGTSSDTEDVDVLLLSWEEIRQMSAEYSAFINGGQMVAVKCTTTLVRVV